MLDGKAFGEEMVGIVRDYVDRATAALAQENLALTKRVELLEGRTLDRGEKGDPGDRGPAGADVDMAAVQRLVDTAVASLPKPMDGKDGAPGRDGADGAPGCDGERGADGQPGRDGADGLTGKDGAPGRDGADGAPGRDGERGADGQPGRDGADGLVGKDGSPGRDGKDGEPGAVGAPGRDGTDGLNGKDGAPGLNGKDGADGIGLAGAIIDRSGQLVVTFTNGQTKDLGLVVGRDGVNGADGEAGAPGRDGFALEAFDAEMKDGGRTLVLSFAQGDLKHAVELRLDTMIYRGVFKDGQPYDRGDACTWAGSLWHCAAPTTEKPGEGSKAWVLAAKRGRDGKDGANGVRGEPGPKGDPGRDGRAFS